jgi:hypothetical protein
MQMHFIAFRKLLRFRRSIRVEFAIRAASKQEARQIAEREMLRMNGYRFWGTD